MVLFARSHRGKAGLIALLVVAVAAVIAVPAFGAGQQQTAGQQGKAVGAVYSLTNGTTGNKVVQWDRLSNGQLKFHKAYATGGKGGLKPEHGCGPGGCPVLDAQNEVIVSANRQWLFAVNAGSNTVSVFKITGGGLKLTDQKPSGGRFPTSVTNHGSLVYVLDIGTLNIAGFTLSTTGKLTPIKGSKQKVSKGAVPSDVPPKQIQFDNTGRWLAVPLLAVPVIDTFPVDSHGVAGKPKANKTAKPLPFAFSVDPKNRLLVAEVVDATIPPDPNPFPPVATGSSYSLNATNGKLHHVSTAAAKGFAACWTAITSNGRYFYVVNTGGGAPTGATVSVFRVSPSGQLKLIQVTAPGKSASSPLPNGDELARFDVAVTPDNRYLYVDVPGVLPNSTSKLDEYKILGNGHLVAIGASAPIKVNGLSGVATS